VIGQTISHYRVLGKLGAGTGAQPANTFEKIIDQELERLNRKAN
jgi:hypothetical protein